jgi:Recombinase/Integrase core domain/Recombinase zinc beta ribbon domain
MFERYASGEPPRGIAADFNTRGIPSPGSSRRRQVRRCRGWMGSAIYTILVNDLYTGHVKWNQHRYERDPDTRIHKRRARPKSEWFSYHDDSLRIVSDELWQRCVRRRAPNSTAKLKCGGRPRFLLSGIMKCGLCGASYVMKNLRDYGCAGYVEGRDCPNHIGIRRDKAEAALLMPLYNDVLAPKRIERMAKELQAAFTKGQNSEEAKATRAPADLDRHGLVNVNRPRQRSHKAQGTTLSCPVHPNELWCADYKGEFMLADKRYCYPLTITDAASRYLLCCEALSSTRASLAFTVFERIFKEFGLPQSALTTAYPLPAPTPSSASQSYRSGGYAWGS